MSNIVPAIIGYFFGLTAGIFAPIKIHVATGERARALKAAKRLESQGKHDDARLAQMLADGADPFTVLKRMTPEQRKRYEEFVQKGVQNDE